MTDKMRNLIISLSALVVAFSVAYYFVFFLPSEQKTKQVAVADCTKEMKQRAQKGEIDLFEVNSMSDGQKYLNVYVDGCMKRKGYLR